MIATTIETGQRNMAVLEQAVIKDNTLCPESGTEANCILRRLPTKVARRRATRS